MTIKLPTPEWDQQLNAAIEAVANAQAALTDARLNLDRIKARLEFKCQANGCGKVYRDRDLPLAHVYVTNSGSDDIIVTDDTYYLKCTCGNSQRIPQAVYETFASGNPVLQYNLADEWDLGIFPK